MSKILKVNEEVSLPSYWSKGQTRLCKIVGLGYENDSRGHEKGQGYFAKEVGGDPHSFWITQDAVDRAMTDADERIKALEERGVKFEPSDFNEKNWWYK